MAKLEALRKRISSVEQLQSVVKTMKALAAVSIRQYERASESMTDYTQAVEWGIQVCLVNNPLPSGRTGAEPPGPIGAIVFGSDQGMCGPFNEQIVDHAMNHPDLKGGDPDHRVFLAIGFRLLPSLEARTAKVEDTLNLPSAVGNITWKVQDILAAIDRWRAQSCVERLLLFHHGYQSSSYEPRTVRLLPLDEPWLLDLQQRDWPTHCLPMVRSDWESTFRAFVRQYLFASIYRAFAESLAAENASRLRAMQAAEQNIEDRLGELNTRFNEQRQSVITEELLDVVSGYETLLGGSHD